MKNVCQEADEIAGQGGDRMRDYGHPLDNHQRIADGWAVLLGRPVTAKQAALCMMWLKLAREMHSPKRDNMVDLCGYAKCYEMIVDEEKRRATSSAAPVAPSPSCSPVSSPPASPLTSTEIKRAEALRDQLLTRYGLLQ